MLIGEIMWCVLLQMNKGMIHGADITVDFASTDNGYIELPPEAVNHQWVKIAAGREGESTHTPIYGCVRTSCHDTA